MHICMLYIFPSVITAGFCAICQGTSHAALVAPRHFRTAACSCESSGTKRKTVSGEKIETPSCH